jgi:glycosyltransferase involved in cell wall biosynthesis
MRELTAGDSRIRMVRFSRNFGQHLASTAGLNYAQGDCAVVIDADLQDPPEVILQMIERWRQGYEVVYATRRNREGESTLYLGATRLFYRLINWLAEIPIPLDTGDFRLLDRKAINVLLAMPERDRFLRGMASWIGFNQISVAYDRGPRLAGITKYSPIKMTRVAMDGILSFSIMPLRLATVIGLAASGLALIGCLAAIVLRLSNGQWIAPWTGVLLATLFMGGAQLICLGIAGEYLGRIYGESKRRPLYVVQEACGFGESLQSKQQSTRS